MAIAAHPGGRTIKHVVVIGAGLAGLAAASALAERGFRVTVLERKSIPGGRASSYDAQDTGELIDNCQHILMRCCTNLWHFFGAAGVQDKIRWVRQIHFLEPNGRVSVLEGSPLPAPLHLMPSFFRLRFLSLRDKLAIAGAFARMLFSHGPKADLPLIEWLRAAGQPQGAIDRFWRPIVVSALNESPEQCSTRYAFQVFRLGFLAHPNAYEMGIPCVPLRDLYGPCVQRLEQLGAQVRFRSSVKGLVMEHGRVVAVKLADEAVPADYVISAANFDALTELLPEAVARLPEFHRWEGMTSTPISAVHLWWDRPVTDHEQVALLDRQLHWMFNKSRDFEREGQGEGTYMGLVVSVSRDWLKRSRREILELAEREVREFFPGTQGAKVVKSAVIKEARATFATFPGVDNLRPPVTTPIANLWLAGDWVQNGWPSTMEAAVRSGYLAAEQVLAAEGRGEPVVEPDLPWKAFLGKP